jgi:hypothetical protein
MGSSYRDLAARGQAELEGERKPSTPEDRSARARRERWERCERAGIPVTLRHRVEGVERRLRKTLGRAPTIAEVKAQIDGSEA